MIYFVTRHAGAIEWMQQQGLSVDKQLIHLDINIIESGDTVIGILPVNLAAEVCAKGAYFFNLSLDIPITMRGKELTANELTQCGARIEPYYVEKR